MRWIFLIGKLLHALIFSGLLFLPSHRLQAQEVECLADISTGFDQEADEPVLEGETDDDYTVDGGFGFESAIVVGSSTGAPIPPFHPGLTTPRNVGGFVPCPTTSRSAEP